MNAIILGLILGLLSLVALADEKSEKLRVLTAQADLYVQLRYWSREQGLDWEQLPGVVFRDRSGESLALDDVVGRIEQSGRDNELHSLAATYYDQGFYPERSALPASVAVLMGTKLDELLLTGFESNLTHQQLTTLAIVAWNYRTLVQIARQSGETDLKTLLTKHGEVREGSERNACTVQFDFDADTFHFR